MPKKELSALNEDQDGMGSVRVTCITVGAFGALVFGVIAVSFGTLVPFAPCFLFPSMLLVDIAQNLVNKTVPVSITSWGLVQAIALIMHIVMGALIGQCVYQWVIMPPLRCTSECRHCDYSLKGNVSGRCPECGTPIPPNQHIPTVNSVSTNPQNEHNANEAPP